MLSKNTIRNVKNLQQKKFRKQTGQFIVEGEKLVQELMQSNYVVDAIYTIDAEMYPQSEPVSSKDLERISALKSPNKVLAVARIPEVEIAFDTSSILLDGVNDPGNLGTIIRLADWYGIKQVVCSPDTVDVFNPKTVQATMGSLFRVQVQYTDLADFIERTSIRTYAAVMDGEELEGPQEQYHLLMGSESHGVSNGLDQKGERITIRRRGQAESLNVGVACGILLDKLTV